MRSRSEKGRGGEGGGKEEEKNPGLISVLKTYKLLLEEERELTGSQAATVRLAEECWCGWPKERGKAKGGKKRGKKYGSRSIVYGENLKVLRKKNGEGRVKENSALKAGDSNEKGKGKKPRSQTKFPLKKKEMVILLFSRRGPRES